MMHGRSISVLVRSWRLRTSSRFYNRTYGISIIYTRDMYGTRDNSGGTLKLRKNKLPNGTSSEGLVKLPCYPRSPVNNPLVPPPPAPQTCGFQQLTKTHGCFTPPRALQKMGRPKGNNRKVNQQWTGGHLCRDP